MAITKTTLNASKYRKNKKNNKFRNNCDFLKGKVETGHLEACKIRKNRKGNKNFLFGITNNNKTR